MNGINICCVGNGKAEYDSSSMVHHVRDVDREGGKARSSISTYIGHHFLKYTKSRCCLMLSASWSVRAHRLLV